MSSTKDVQNKDVDAFIELPFENEKDQIIEQTIEIFQSNLSNKPEFVSNDQSLESQDKVMQIANNLQSLDEVMDICNQSKARSSSINIDQREGKRQKSKLQQEDNSSKQHKNMHNSTAFEEFFHKEEKISCQNKEIIHHDIFDDILQDKNDSMKSRTKQLIEERASFNNNNNNNNNQQDDKEIQNMIQVNQRTQFGGVDEIQDVNLEVIQNRMAKLKNRMQITILSQNVKSDNSHQVNVFSGKGNYSSPINEIQSDNSSSSQKDQIQQHTLQKELSENISQSQVFTKLLKDKAQIAHQYDSVDVLKSDEFTQMFESNCPIKSPTFATKIRKKTAQFESTNSKKNSDDKKPSSSISTIKDELVEVDNSQQILKSVQNNRNQLIRKSNLEESNEIIDQTFGESSAKSLEKADQRQINVDQGKEAIQLGFIADIKQVRNHKVNAFRSRLNLSLNEVDNNDEIRKKSSTINSDLALNEPISIMKLQKINQGYNTVETPSTNKRHLQVNINKTTKHSLSLRSNFQIEEETNDEHKDNDLSLGRHKNDISNDSSITDNDCQTENKRKFQRKKLFVKVDHVKADEKEDIWQVEEMTTDQQNQEVPIVTKAKQGTNKFEDKYQILNGRTLGEGTSGCVYQCKKKNSDDETIYAVKVIRNVDDEMSKTIFQTFGIQYRLQHESISKVYEVYYNEDNQTIHYIMDYIPFRPLDSVLKDKKRVLKEIEASSIIQLLLKAVCYMEQRGVCHRDLKPENILISEDLQQIKIIDFGISKSFVKSQRFQHITQYYKHKMYTPTGTPSYKAPEILLGAGYTQLVDMWAIGVIAYQLINRGKHPFKCDSQQEQDKRISRFQFNQTEEGWVKASANTKNFIKSLLRANRMPAFEALKHPWIEQRKIQIPADDDNHTQIKQEKKPSNDSMTTSVPVHFQPRQFNGFGITVTNSEQQQRSNFSKITEGEAYDDNQIPLRACNTINSTNEFDSHAASGNTNAQISTYGKSKGKIKLGQTGEIDNQDKEIQGNSPKQEATNQLGENKTPGLIKKKHSIQGFSEAKDVMHVVMRQKLSESRERMMKFLMKANTIIKNLEEEQLMQINPKTQALKRTHSAEKQCDSPTTPDEILNRIVLNTSGNAGSSLNVFRNSSSGNQFKEEGSNNNQQNIFQGAQQNQGQQSQNQSQSSSDESTRFMMKMNNSIIAGQQQNALNILNKGAQSSLNSVGKNNSINDGTNTSYNNNNSIGAGNAMIYSTSDFSNMKFSSLMSRKTSCNRQRDKKLVRRNSSQQTNCMQKSIIFTKEVIEELQKDPVIQETFGNDNSQPNLINSMFPYLFGQQIPQQAQDTQMTNSIMLKSFNNFGLNYKFQRPSIDQNQTLPGGENRNIQSSQSYSLSYSNKESISNSMPMVQDIFQKAISNYMTEDQKKQENEKWKLITENMDQRSDSGITEKEDKGNSEEDDDDDDDSSSADSNIDSNENTFSIDVTNLLLNPNQLNLAQYGQSDNVRKGSSSSQKQSTENEQNISSNDKLENENISSISSKKTDQNTFSSNHGSEECKDYLQEKLSNKNTSSLSFSSGGTNQQKMSQQIQQQQGGIFQSTPYTNYMNSSKDNKLNQTLLSIQNLQDGNLQPAAVLTTSGSSSKENISSNHNLSHRSESSSTKNNQKNQQNSSSEDKQFNNSQPNSNPHVLLKEVNNNQVNQNQSYCSNCSNNSQGCINCQPTQKADQPLQFYRPDVVLSLINIQPDQQYRSSKNCDSIQNSIIYDKIAKDKQNDVSIMDSLGNNLSFIDMNHSNIVQSVNGQSSEEFISHSLKKNNFFVSMNVSQASSINAGNISLSGSGNTIRSLHAMTQNSNPNNLPNSNNNNSENSSNTQINIKEKANSSRFRNQSDMNNCNSSNSIFKRQQGNKLDLDMSESQQYCPADNVLQTSGHINQKQYIDTGLNSSNEVTPSKFYNLLGDDTQNQQIHSQQQQQQQQNQSENSKEMLNHRQNSNKPIISTTIDNDIQFYSSSCISPPKRSANFNMTISKECHLQGKQNQFDSLNEESNQSQINECLPQQQVCTNNTQAGNRYLKTVHSTIIEDSSEARSCVTSSIAQSQRLNSEFDSPTNQSGGLQFHRKTYTRSLTQMNQSNSERTENSMNNQSGLINPCASSILINQMILPLQSRQEIISTPQIGVSSEDYEGHNDLEQQQSNDNKNNSAEITNSPKKNYSKKMSGLSKMSKQKLSPQTQLSVNNAKVSSSVHKQLDEVFGQMQSSSSFMRQEDYDQNDYDNNNNNYNDHDSDENSNKNKSPISNSKIQPHISQNVKQTSPKETNLNINKASSTTLSEQPPLLKHRSSSKILEKSNSLQNSKMSRDSSSIERSQDDMEEENNYKIQFHGMIGRAVIEAIPENKNDECEYELKQENNLFNKHI